MPKLRRAKNYKDSQQELTISLLVLFRPWFDANMPWMRQTRICRRQNGSIPTLQQLARAARLGRQRKQPIRQEALLAADKQQRWTCLPRRKHRLLGLHRTGLYRAAQRANDGLAGD